MTQLPPENTPKNIPRCANAGVAKGDGVGTHGRGRGDSGELKRPPGLKWEGGSG